MIYNRIPIAFNGLNKITGQTISYQYDVRTVLVFEDLDLPQYYEVDICNEGDPSTVTMVGTSDGVLIPNAFLRTGRRVKVYIVVQGTDPGAVETRKELTLPVQVRPAREDIDPTEPEQQQIDELVAALNEATEAAAAVADAIPAAGYQGQILAKRSDDDYDTEWIDSGGGGGGGAVDSVNGQTGVVVLDADDVGAVAEPTTAGTAGQVLGLDSNLVPVWVDQTGGGGGGDLSDEIKEALLDCFENVAWTSGDSATLIQALREAFYGEAFDITYNLTNCTSSNTETSVYDGQSYQTTISAVSGATLSSVTCTMGGVPQTVTEGVINIASVNGDIIITATAIADVSIGYTLVGNPSITDGVLTPSDGNYVLADCDFSTMTGKSWEIQTKIYGTANTLYQDLISTVDSQGNGKRCVLLEFTSGGGGFGPKLWLGDGGSNWNISSASPYVPSYSMNTWTWIKFGWDGSQYYASSSTDGETFTSNTKSSTTAIGSFEKLSIGRKVNAVFVGQIDLNETRCYVDGSLFWRAV